MPNPNPLSITANDSLHEPEEEFVDCPLDGMTTRAQKLKVPSTVLSRVKRRPALDPQTMMVMPLRDNTVKSKIRVGTTTLTEVSIKFP